MTPSTGASEPFDPTGGPPAPLPIPAPVGSAEEEFPTPLPLSFPPKVGSLAQKTAGGFAWTMVQTVVTKVVNFVSTIVLAKLLLQSDFGVAGTAFAIATFANLIQEAGLQQILIHRQAEFGKQANAAFWMSVATGLLGGTLMSVLALPAARFCHAPQLAGLMLVLAIRSPFLALGTVPNARLQNELRFKVQAALQMVVATVVVALSIILAWLLRPEYKAYAFVLPLLGGAILRAILLWMIAPTPIRADFELGLWKNMAGSSCILLLTSFLFTVTSQGDYLVLAHLQTTYVAGIYYFAYNLTLQTTQFLTVNLSSVLFPTLSKLQHDPDRQRRAFLRATNLLMLFGVPICLLQAAVAGPMVRIMFPKWEASIAVLQVISVAMSLQLVNMPALGMIQAQGRFKAQFLLSILCAVLFLGMVLVAAKSGGGDAGIISWPWLARPLKAVFDARANVPVVVALAVTIYCSIIGPTCLYTAIRPVGGTIRDIWPIYVLPLGLSGLAIGLGMLVCHYLPGTRLGDYGKILGITLISAAVYLPAVRRLAPDSWAELIQRLQGFRRQKAAA